MLTNPVELPFARYRMQFRAIDPVQLPAFAGSTWRGALGTALKRLVCVTNLPTCAPCALVQSCAYAYLFETAPPRDAEKMRKYPALPHPFILNPPLGSVSLVPGTDYHLELTLIGYGNRHLPYFLLALERAAQRGLGHGRGRLQWIATERYVGGPDETVREIIHQPGRTLVNPPPVVVAAPPEPPKNPIQIEILTPLRLRREGKPIRPEVFRFADLFSSLLRRISMLTYFHSDHPLETDFKALTEAAKNVHLANLQLQWCQWHRFSSRQKKDVPMDGLLGSFTLPTESIGLFWPYLWLGQYVHAGAGASMGQGRYEMKIGKG